MEVILTQNSHLCQTFKQKQLPLLTEDAYRIHYGTPFHCERNLPKFCVWK